MKCPAPATLSTTNAGSAAARTATSAALTPPSCVAVPRSSRTGLHPLRLAPLRHGEKRLEGRVQVVGGARRITVDHALAHPRWVARCFDQLAADLPAHQLHSAEQLDPGRERHGAPKRTRGGTLRRPAVE